MAGRSTKKSLKYESPLAHKDRTKNERKLRTQSNVMRSIWVHQIQTKTERKLRAQRHVNRTIWLGLGMMGLTDWSVAVPTLIGAALGLWLDKYYPESFSWTLTMLIIGLLIGCLNAWYWVAKERREILQELKE